MKRIVVDTSVLIRYLIRPSVAVRELVEERWLGDQVLMVSCPELIQELEGVLARPTIQSFIHPDEGQTLLDTVRSKAEFLPPLGEVPAFTRDPKDDKFVACALAGQAAFVVTLDKDILALRELAAFKWSHLARCCAYWTMPSSQGRLSQNIGHHARSMLLLSDLAPF